MIVYAVLVVLVIDLFLVVLGDGTKQSKMVRLLSKRIVNDFVVVIPRCK